MPLWTAGTQALKQWDFGNLAAESSDIEHWYYLELRTLSFPVE